MKAEGKGQLALHKHILCVLLFQGLVLDSQGNCREKQLYKIQGQDFNDAHGFPPT